MTMTTNLRIFLRILNHTECFNERIGRPCVVVWINYRWVQGAWRMTSKLGMASGLTLAAYAILVPCYPHNYSPMLFKDGGSTSFLHGARQTGVARIGSSWPC
jgi:hypothetical protein